MQNSIFDFGSTYKLSERKAPKTMNLILILTALFFIQNIPAQASRCPQPIGDFSDHPQGCKHLSFVWSEPSAEDMNLADAQAFCASLPIAERSTGPWSLPTQEQFAKLTAQGVAFKAMPAVDFARMFWSNSKKGGQPAGVSPLTNQLYRLRPEQDKVSVMSVMPVLKVMQISASKYITCALTQGKVL